MGFNSAFKGLNKNRNGSDYFTQPENLKSHDSVFSNARVLGYGRTDGQTDTENQMEIFLSNFRTGKPPKIELMLKEYNVSNIWKMF
jgi:hypothetical protein